MSEFTEKDIELIDRLAERVVKLQLTTPAIFMLEAVKPLNVIGSQTLVFFGPMLYAFFNQSEINRIADLLERRETIEEIILRIELKDEEYYRRRLEAREAKKIEAQKKKEST